jgi:hypothetical protein
MQHQEDLVHQRLARLAEQVGVAGERRWPMGTATPPEQFAAAVAALRVDHADAQGLGDVSDSAHADVEPGERRLHQLAEIFALSALDLDLLIVAASAEFDPNFAAAYGVLVGARTAARPTVALALELCQVPTMAAPGRARLGPAAPLRNHGLLELVGDEPLLGRALRVPDRVVAHLLGDDTLDPTVAGMRIDSVPVDLPETAVLANAIEHGEPICWVHAGLGAVGLSVAAGAFESLAISCVVVDLKRCPGDVPLDHAVRLAARDAALLGCGLVATGAELLADDANTWMLRLLRDAAVPVVAVADVGWQARWLDRLPAAVFAPSSTKLLRDQLWRSMLKDAPVDDAGWDDLVGLRISPEQIAQAARYVDTRAAGNKAGDGADLSVRELLDAARRVGSARSAATSRKPSATFDDLVLPDSTLDSMKQLVAWARQRDVVLARNPRLVSGGKGRGVSALFAGAPGTGKTLAAHVVADSLNLDLYQVELPTVVDKYIGETEKNLQRVFHEAENLNAVLFFDEADSLFGSRSEVRDSRDRYANIEVAYLLQRMEQFDGIAILATNLRGNLDVAFSRRLQFIVHFPDPDEATRRQLWLRHLEGFAPLDADDPLDVDHLARGVELAGGDIRNIVMAAAYGATDEGSALGMRHVVVAVERELRKLGRRVPAQGFGSSASS